MQKVMQDVDNTREEETKSTITMKNQHWRLIFGGKIQNTPSIFLIAMRYDGGRLFLFFNYQKKMRLNIKQPTVLAFPWHILKLGLMVAPVQQ